MRPGCVGGWVGLTNGQWYPVAPLNVKPVTTSDPIVPLTWPLLSIMTVAPARSFICQFASVAADAGAASARTTVIATVSDDPKLFLMLFPLLCWLCRPL